MWGCWCLSPTIDQMVFILLLFAQKYINIQLNATDRSQSTACMRRTTLYDSLLIVHHRAKCFQSNRLQKLLVHTRCTKWKKWSQVTSYWARYGGFSTTDFDPAFDVNATVRHNRFFATSGDIRSVPPKQLYGTSTPFWTVLWSGSEVTLNYGTPMMPNSVPRSCFVGKRV